jgi:hypothetical protein
MGATTLTGDWMGATSVLRKGETIARSTRGEATLPRGGGSTANCTSQHVSHKSKSQNCESVIRSSVLSLNIRIPCSDVQYYLAEGPLRSCRSAFPVVRKSGSINDVLQDRLDHDSQNLQGSEQIHHKTI